MSGETCEGRRHGNYGQGDDPERLREDDETDDLPVVQAERSCRPTFQMLCEQRLAVCYCCGRISACTISAMSAENLMTRPVSRAANSGESLSPPRMLKPASADNSATGRAPERYRKQRIAATANAIAGAPVRLVSRAGERE